MGPVDIVPLKNHLSKALIRSEHLLKPYEEYRCDGSAIARWESSPVVVPSHGEVEQCDNGNHIG